MAAIVSRPPASVAPDALPNLRLLHQPEGPAVARGVPRREADAAARRHRTGFARQRRSTSQTRYPSQSAEISIVAPESPLVLPRQHSSQRLEKERSNYDQIRQEHYYSKPAHARSVTKSDIAINGTRTRSAYAIGVPTGLGSARTLPFRSTVRAAATKIRNDKVAATRSVNLGSGFITHPHFQRTGIKRLQLAEPGWSTNVPSNKNSRLPLTVRSTPFTETLVAHV